MNKLHSGSLIQVEEQNYIILDINDNSDKSDLSEIEKKQLNTVLVVTKFFLLEVSENAKIVELRR